MTVAIRISCSNSFSIWTSVIRAADMCLLMHFIRQCTKCYFSVLVSQLMLELCFCNHDTGRYLSIWDSIIPTSHTMFSACCPITSTIGCVYCVPAFGIGSSLAFLTCLGIFLFLTSNPFFLTKSSYRIGPEAPLSTSKQIGTSLSNNSSVA